jgi:hypothetical protein
MCLPRCTISGMRLLDPARTEQYDNPLPATRILRADMCSIGVVFHEHEAMYCCGIENEFSFTDFPGVNLSSASWAGNWFNLGIKQILLNFTIFVAVGFLINHFVPTSIVSGYSVNNSIFAVPLASVYRLPLY